MNDGVSAAEIMPLVVEIVSAHVSGNSVPPDALPVLVRSVFEVLSGLGSGVEPEGPLVPVVPISRSVFPDYIVCLEDGLRFKMLRRHLEVDFGMTPSEYRQRWGLPSTYPMVAPNYARYRMQLAKAFGLGRIPTAAEGSADEVGVQRIAEGVSGKRSARRLKEAAE